MLSAHYKPGLIEDLCTFVRIPSRSSAQGGEEGPLQRLIAERMRALGARVRTFEPDDIPAFRTHPLCHGPDRQYAGRPTVLGEIGPEDAPALLVLAHSDTVQIHRPEAWTFDPFRGEVREGTVCGLGACDDKWGLATLLAIMRALKEAGTPLRKRVVFASTIDEENGVGNGTLLLALAGVQAEAALYLDGVDMQVCIGNLGGSNLFLRPRKSLPTETFERHSRQIEEACREMSRRRAALFTGSCFRDNLMREQSVVPRRMNDVQGPFLLLNFYTLPGEERARICADLEARVSQALGEAISDYALGYREPWFEPALIDPEMPLVRYLADSFQQTLHTEPCITTISKQDAFVLTNHAGIPTVSFGPARPEGNTYHQPDECVDIDKVWASCRIAYDTVCRWLGDSIS